MTTVPRAKTLSHYDKMILSVLLMLGLFFGFKLFTNKSQLATNIQRPIGIILEQKNTLKHKSSLQLLWTDTHQGAPVGVNDQLYTYSQSQTSILLNTGTQLELNENTLIKIADPHSLKLERGEVVFNLKNTQKAISLLLDGETFTLKSNQAVVKIKKQNHQTQIQLQQGQLALAQNGKDIQIKRGEEISLQKDTYQEWAPALEPTTPLPPGPERLAPADPFELMSYETSSSVSFQWKARQETPSQIVLINRETGIERSEQVITSNITLKLVPGQYHWKVRHVDSSQTPTSQWSPLYDLEIKRGDWDEKVVKIVLKKPDQKVSFTWKNSTGEEVLFQLGDQQGLEAPLIEKKIAGNSTSIEFPKLGTYYWRVRSTKQPQKLFAPVKVIVEPTPAPQGFRIPEEQDIPIKFKQDSSFFQYFLDLLIARAVAQNQMFSEISWQAQDNAKYYILEIYHDPELKKIVLKKNIKAAYYEWDTPKEGTYYWRVAYMDFWNRQSPFSNLAKINLYLPAHLKKQKPVQLMAPYHNQEIPPQNTTIQFKWSPVERTRNYVIKVAKDLDFQEIIYERTVKVPKEKISLPELKQEKELYWRVTYQNPLGDTIKSKRRRLKLKKPVPQSQPPAETPKVVLTQRKKRKRVNTLISLTYLPTSVDYELNQSATKIKIKGEAINSQMLESAHFISPSISLHSHIERQVGEVFETLDYQNFVVQGALKWNVYPIGRHKFFLRGGVQLRSLSLYQVVSQAVQEISESDLGFSLGGGYHHTFSSDWRGELNGQFTLGDLGQFSGQIKSIHSWSPHWRFNLMARYSVLTYELNSIDSDMSSLSLGAGMTYLLSL